MTLLLAVKLAAVVAAINVTAYEYAPPDGGPGRVARRVGAAFLLTAALWWALPC